MPALQLPLWPKIGLPVPSYLAPRVLAKLRALAPSEWWVSEGYRWYAEQVEAGALPAPRTLPAIDSILYRHQVLPPGGYRTGMKRCAACDRWEPAYYLDEAGVCFDCLEPLVVDEDAPGWDDSGHFDAISAVARGSREAVHRRGRAAARNTAPPLADVPLPSEDEGVLLGEIRRYRETGKVKGKVDWHQRDGRWGMPRRAG